MGRAMSQSSDVMNKALPNLNSFIDEQVRRSVSESYPSTPPPPPPQAIKSNTLFSHFLRRKKKQDEPFDNSLPPPAPPKDKGKFSVQQPHHHHMSTQALVSHRSAVAQDISQRSRANSLSEFAVISRSSSPDEVIMEPSSPTAAETPAPQPTFGHSLPLRGKWTPETSLIVDPAERARRRAEAQRQREIEEEEAIQQETKRQAQLKLEKQKVLRQEMEEEEQRRASLEGELRRITAERRRKDEVEREEEERKRQELEDRKRVDRERRLEEHRRLEEWRKKQARLVNEAAQRAEEARRQEEAERKKRIQLVEAKVRSNAKAESLVTGWVTMQTSDSLVWKRRFFKFIGSTVFFYRSPKVRTAKSSGCCSWWMFTRTPVWYWTKSRCADCSTPWENGTKGLKTSRLSLIHLRSSSRTGGDHGRCLRTQKRRRSVLASILLGWANLFVTGQAPGTFASCSRSVRLSEVGSTIRIRVSCHLIPIILYLIALGGSNQWSLGQWLTSRQTL